MGSPESNRTRPIPLPSDQDASGRTLGVEELGLLEEVLRSGILTSTKGTFVKRFEERFAEMLAVPHAHACASGTAAVHVAIAAIDPEPGDEVVTSPITDMGALTPILYQGAIPVFADVDPRTCNLTAATIEPRLSQRTRAIVVTHLFGNPCPMDEILELARSRRIPVIEDCSQAFQARWAGRPVGTLGAIGCFSLQQGKHITTGEGGLVVTADTLLARRMFLIINKAWGYGDEKPDHYFLALNHRLSELQGAVGLAQLGKLEQVVHNRIESAVRLTAMLQGLPGIQTPFVRPEAVHTYWKYCLRVDGQRIAGGPWGWPAGSRTAALLRPRAISRSRPSSAPSSRSKRHSAPVGIPSPWRAPKRWITISVASLGPSRVWKGSWLSPGTSGTGTSTWSTSRTHSRGVWPSCCKGIADGRAGSLRTCRGRGHRTNLCAGV